MLLSIIIPVYKVEKYISKCLISCLNQREVCKDDYELIIVNDGTPDNSMKIVESLLSDYKDKIYFKIINQKNAGLSMARNTGIRKASGKYVWFVDSDDWIGEFSVKNIKKALINDNVDILQIQYKMVFEDNIKCFSEDIVHINGVVSGADCMREQRLPNLAQSRIIKRNYLIDNNIYFTPGILHEDAEFKPRAVWPAKSIKSIPNICYYYFKRNSNSITSSFTLRNAEGRIYGVKSMHQFSKDFPKNDQKAFNPDINFNLFFVIHEYPKLNQIDKKYLINKIKELKPIFKRLRRNKSLKLSIIYSLLSLYPAFSMKFYDKLYKMTVQL